MHRTEFAERLVSGLSGWFQQLAAQELHLQVGEDAARVELVRMISAQRAFIPETSKRPLGWPSREIDVAVLGRRTGAGGWYGAIELKWPGTANAVSAVRQDIVQDALRVAFSPTSNMNAKFVIVGGSAPAMDRLFDQAHPQSATAESQRVKFVQLFSRNLASPDRQLTNKALLSAFPAALGRIHPNVTNGWKRRFATSLVAMAEARVGTAVKGQAFVWQCAK